MALTTVHSAPAHTAAAFHGAPSGFDALVADLRTYLRHSPGTTLADIDPAPIEAIMREYTSRESDWADFALSDFSRAYTRNLIDAGDGRYNLMILVWTPGKTSPVHDHAASHCVMKVLKGRLRETLYDWPAADPASAPLKVSRQTTYTVDEVTYMSDQMGLHDIANVSADEAAVSIHLYTPPNASVYGCHIFDRMTGNKRFAGRCAFYSEAGKKIAK